MVRGSSYGLVVAMMVGAMSLFACGGDSDDGSGGGAGAGGGGAGGPIGDTACVDCVKANCNSEATACYGSSWQSGDFGGGACGPMITCVMQCGSNTSCLQGCEQYDTEECQTAADALSTCSNANCATEC